MEIEAAIKCGMKKKKKKTKKKKKQKGKEKLVEAGDDCRIQRDTAVTENTGTQTSDWRQTLLFHLDPNNNIK